MGCVCVCLYVCTHIWCACVCVRTLSLGEQTRALHMLNKYPTYSTPIYFLKCSFPLQIIGDFCIRLLNLSIYITCEELTEIHS